MTPDPLIGRKIGSYQVERKLGEGGMGSVYELLHPGIGKQLALKLLHAEYAAKPQIVKRFFDEARAVNVIQHPNIVDIIDFAELDDGRSYLTMEFLPGDSLSEYIRDNGALSPADAAAIALPICSALQAAHNAGITHRDLKPENIHLVPRPDNPRYVKVLDFGIAKLSGELQAGGATRSGVVMGTPMYMSPEQAMGRTREIDHRTDIYALGVILYQMLVGRVPFEAESFGDLMLMHLQAPVPPMQQVRPDLPDPWNDLVQRALAKSREHRFASMDEMAAAIRAALAGQATTGAATVAMQPAAGALGAPPPVLMSPSWGSVAPAYSTAPPHTVALPSPTVASSGTSAWKVVAIIVGAVGATALGIWVALMLLASDGNEKTAAAGATFDAAPVARLIAAADAGVAGAPVNDTVATSTGPDAGAQTATLERDDPADERARAEQEAHDKRRKDRKEKEAKEKAAKEKAAKEKAAKEKAAKEKADVGNGSIKVTAVPWAYVSVDGKSHGKTPLTLELSAGTHTIKVDNPDIGKSTSKRVTIKRGKTETLRFQMSEL